VVLDRKKNEQMVSSQSNVTEGCIVTTHGRYSLYFTMGRLFSLKITPFQRGIWTPSNIWFLGAHQSPQPKGHFGSAVFVGLTIVTDHATLITISCIYECVHSTAMRTKNKLHIHYHNFTLATGGTKKDSTQEPNSL